jgi:aminoglycoside phosphotransferase (APT) family kinase protein
MRAARWLRAEPRRSLPDAATRRILEHALPGTRAISIEPLTDGLRNANFRLELDGGPRRVVLRIYEHDESICRKEIDLLRRIHDDLPVPEVLFAEPRGFEDVPPFAVLRWVEGITIRELMRSRDSAAIRDAAFSAGQTLAVIGRFQFEKSGWIGPGLQIGPPIMDGPNAMPRFLDRCLESEQLQTRVSQEQRERIHQYCWIHAREYEALNAESRLVHCDFSRRNIIVRETAGKWAVSGVLDWEFAVSATPLIDIGNFLRHEPLDRPRLERHFSAGYLDGGGCLFADWRKLSRLADLLAICEALTHETLPADAAAELIGMLP